LELLISKPGTHALRVLKANYWESDRKKMIEIPLIFLNVKMRGK
jgi:hypothetical protein